MFQILEKLLVLNVKEDLKENTSDRPKNNTPEHVNDISTDPIDAFDRNIIIDKNPNSNPNNIAESILDNSQLINFVVSENIASNDTSSNSNEALSNTNSIDVDDMRRACHK